MGKRVTKKENFRAIVEILEEACREDLVAVMENEIALLDKKKASAKMTKTQEANTGIKDLILKTLRDLARPVTITELISESPALAQVTGGSNQKVSALMTQLKNDNKVVRTQEGKKALFTVTVDISDYEMEAE